MQDIERIKNGIEVVRKAFPDMHYDVEMMLAEDNLVCSYFRVTATHQGEFMGMKPTGKTYHFGETVISRFEEGKIAEEWQFTSHPGLLEQMGITPTK